MSFSFLQHCHNLRHEDNDMLRTYITITNTATDPGGPNSGNDDVAFTEVNGIIYDNYQFASPFSVGPIPTAEHPTPRERATEFLNANFYRIFYPLPDDVEAVRNNPWLAIDASNCPALP